MFQLCWQDGICWTIFLFILKRDAIIISNLVLRKSISHSLALQTIQAAQWILCPYGVTN